MPTSYQPVGVMDMSRIATHRMPWPVVLSLCLGLAFAATCHAQNEPLIAEVRVEGNDYISAEAIIAEVSDICKIGAPLTAQVRALAIAKIKKLGYFDEVTDLKGLKNNQHYSSREIG